jgi:TetR/AcrR family acrAB operon transcriptional repressor
MVRKTKEEAALTHRSLLKAALAVFGERGYSAATLQDVAARAGVTRGAIYWHFGSKAELYAALIEEYSTRGAEITQGAIAEGGTYSDVLRRVFVRLLIAVEEDADLRAAMELSMYKTEMTDELQHGLRQQRQAGRRLLQGIAGAMQQGIDSGELRPDVRPEDMAHAFIALQNGAIYLWLADPRAFSLRGIADALAEIYLMGVHRRP